MSTPTLVATWDKYRLLMTNSYPGTLYTIERDYKDSLGAPRWMELHTWYDRSGEAPDAESLSALVDLATPLLTEVKNLRTRWEAIREIVPAVANNLGLLFPSDVKDYIETLKAERDAALAELAVLKRGEAYACALAGIGVDPRESRRNSCSSECTGGRCCQEES